MATITLSMIVKNEEKYLKNCLESVKDVVDEIVIVDTGSTDGTINIANDFKAKVYTFNWIDDFSAARNFALSKSSRDWILYLDADERLDEKSKIELKKIIKSDETLGIKCLVKSLDENGGASQMMRYTRLFKNSSSIKFTGKVHEQIENSLVENNYQIINSDIEIIHLGYSVKKEELKNKANRNLDILLREFENNKSAYNSYQIANSYSILNNSQQANKYYTLALGDKNLEKEYKSVCYSNLADYEMRNYKLSNAKKFIDEGLRNDKRDVLINVIASQIYNKLNDGNKSLHYCKKAYQLGLESANTNNHLRIQEIKINSSKIIYEGILYSLQFDNNEYLKYFLKQLSSTNNKESVFFSKIINTEHLNKEELEELISNIAENNIVLYLQFINKINDSGLKLDIYSNLFNRFSNNSKFLNNFGSFLIEINQIDEAKIIFESALNNEEYEDSTIFYLSSVYIQTNEIDKLRELVLTAEAKSAGNELFTNKLRILKEKISPLLNPA